MNQTGMVGSENNQETVNQAAIQVVTAVMMALRDVDVKSQSASTASPRKPQRHGAWP